MDEEEFRKLMQYCEESIRNEELLLKESCPPLQGIQVKVMKNRIPGIGDRYAISYVI